MSMWQFEAFRAFLFFAVTIAITISDIRSMRIPNPLSIGGSVAMIGLLLPQGISQITPYIIAGFTAATMFLVVRILSKGLGLGDVKLAFLIGLFLGPIGSIASFFISAISGIAYALVMIIVFKKNSSFRIPYAPFLVSGSYVAYGLQFVPPYSHFLATCFA